VQRISSDLRPGPLHELGLAAALEWQLAEFQKRSGIVTTLAVPEGELAITERISIALYRALQEALTNVARHANASRVRVALRMEADALSLDVGDDGRGITHDEQRGSHSLGLLGLRERALTLGGTVTISGDPATGTNVALKLPLGPMRRVQ
jgi:signal transduction histidine kinase